MSESAAVERHRQGLSFTEEDPRFPENILIGLFDSCGEG